MLRSLSALARSLSHWVFSRCIGGTLLVGRWTGALLEREAKSTKGLLVELVF